LTDDKLRAEIIRLGPWHHDIHVRGEITTAISAGAKYAPEYGTVSMLRGWREEVVNKLLRVYPNGLEGRSVMDCSCNCAECLFWAKEIGAGECFGSDVREHWINQARFLLKHREGPKDGIRVEVCDVYDLPKLGLQRFDIVLHHGLLYHLPDPIQGLKVAADLTRDLLVVNTVTKAGLPDGLLSMSFEGTEPVLSGVYGLRWFPSGPEVLKGMLRWMGFVDFEVLWWHKDWGPPHGPVGCGRMELLASKLQDGLKHVRRDSVGSAP
jgi:SAM-dependent methyltransferase